MGRSRAKVGRPRASTVLLAAGMLVMTARAVTATGRPGIRPASSGVCGDAVVDPGEACDLGSENGIAGSGCTADCRITGRCTVSRTECETADQCPTGEGCCGNGVVETGEDCDDGNLFDLDCCSRACRVEPTGSPGVCDDGTTSCTSSADCGGAVCHRDCQPQTCAAVGPHLVAAAVGHTTMRDRNADGVSERWTTKGTFTLRPGQVIAPDTESVELVFSEGGTVLYDATLPAGSFSPVPFACPRAWKFRDQLADVPGAIGWRTGRFRQDQVYPGKCSATIGFRFLSWRNGIVTTPAGDFVRQSIRIGDDCATAVVTCRRSAVGSQLVCVPFAP